MQVKGNSLYLGGVRAEELLGRHGSPLYVYEEGTIRRKYAELFGGIRSEKLKIYYACKANTNVHILKLLKDLGAGLEAVSEGEVLAALKAGFRRDRIMFTCDNITEEELRFLVRKRVQVNIDSLSQLEKYGRLNPGGAVGIRVNQGIGAGHHQHVITGGASSKFGIYHSQLDGAKRIAVAHGLTISGIHQHIGSNILDESIFLRAMQAILNTAGKFDDLKYINFGGGLGVPYRPGERPLSMKRLGSRIVSVFDRFCKDYGGSPDMIFEPGRYLVCEAGVLLVKVTDIKQNPGKKFVGVDSGFNHLIRPTLYGSYHPVINVSNLRGKREKVSIAGNICESGDIFASDRLVPACKEGDTLAILNAGAYGFAMSSNYNTRPRPAEIMASKGRSWVIRKREKAKDIIA